MIALEREVDIRILASPRTADLAPNNERFVFARNALWTTDLAAGYVRMLRKQSNDFGDFDIAGNRVIAKNGKAIRAWDLRTNTLVVEYMPRWVGFHVFRSASRDGTRVLTSRANKTFSVWDMKKKKELVTFTEKKSFVCGAVLSIDAKIVVHGGTDGIVRFFDVARREHVARVPEKGWIETIARSADGRFFASAGRAGNVAVWTARATRHRLLRGHRGAITRLAMSPDGARVIACGSATRPLMWDVESGDIVATIDGYATSGLRCGVSSVRFSKDGKRIITMGNDGRVCLWRYFLPRFP
jgi:WD40 repeat protein